MSEVKGVPKKLVKITPDLLINTLKLFKAVPVNNQSKKNPSEKITNLTIQHGFIFAPSVVANYSDAELRAMIDTITNEIGVSPEQMNQTFHKSWKKVRDAPFYQLLIEQIQHYMTTYGYESLGSYSEDTVFIPHERLDIPEIDGGVKLTVINGYTKKQLKEKLVRLLNSGIALKSTDEVMSVATFCEFTDEEAKLVNNKEVRIRLYHDLDLVPANNLDLLRLAVYEKTQRTLLINNKGTVELIKASKTNTTKLFEQYDEDFGYKRLAQIFRRFKPLFLAFKAEHEMVPIINKISHLSDKYHVPMKPSLLNNITGLLKQGKKINKTELNEELNNVNIFRKIRLAQSLRYRMSGNKSILYKIRNGKGYASEIDFTNITGAEKIYDTIIDSIADNLKHLKGKEFYIPENIIYALPATEKQFTGNIPSGSYVKVGKDMIFGVWWSNVKTGKKSEPSSVDEFGIDMTYGRGNFGHDFGRRDIHDGQLRVDLDLHAVAQNAGHIGWNSSYRSGNRSVLFSGDMVNAPLPKGASELCYINKDYDDLVLLTLNYFNYDPNTPIPYKLVLAEEHVNSFGSHYTINPNNVKCVIPSVIDKPQIVLGLGTVKDGECRFYFSETGLGNTIAIKNSKYVQIARNYMAEFSKTQVTFNEILERVGAKIVHQPTKKSIDLSIEALQRDTFINLLIKQ